MRRLLQYSGSSAISGILISIIPLLTPHPIPMPYKNLEPVSKQLTIVIGLTVVGFMTFGLALSYYRNILFEQTLINIRKQNDKLAESIEQGYRDLEYFRSAQYKDKYAKENLGLINPGESVLIIQKGFTAEISDQAEDSSQKEQQQAAFLELLHQMPVPDHWKLYFFHREKIDELKKGR